MKKFLKPLPGFALVEATMALIVLGIISSLIFPMIISLITYEKSRKTIDHQQQILRALAHYALNNSGTLPAPNQSELLNIESPEKRIGIIPYKLLGIPKNVAKDGYGRWFTYALHPKLISGIPKAGNDFSYFSDVKTEEFKITDMHSNEVLNTSPNNQVIMVLISHGPSGNGAFTEDGLTRSPTTNPYEAENADNTLSFRVGETKDFKQNVLWMTKNHFISSYIGKPTYIPSNAPSATNLDRRFDPIFGPRR